LRKREHFPRRLAALAANNIYNNEPGIRIEISPIKLDLKSIMAREKEVVESNNLQMLNLRRQARAIGLNFR